MIEKLAREDREFEESSDSALATRREAFERFAYLVQQSGQMQWGIKIIIEGGRVRVVLQ